MYTYTTRAHGRRTLLFMFFSPDALSSHPVRALESFVGGSRCGTHELAGRSLLTAAPLRAGVYAYRSSPLNLSSYAEPRETLLSGTSAHGRGSFVVTTVALDITIEAHSRRRIKSNHDVGSFGVVENGVRQSRGRPQMVSDLPRRRVKARRVAGPAFIG